MQHSPTGLPEPQKHGSPFLQHIPAGLPDPHAHGAVNSAFFASSIVLQIKNYRDLFGFI